MKWIAALGLNAHQKRTFVVGFGPFGEILDNPSERLAKGSRRPHHILKVSYSEVDDFLETLEPKSFDRLLLMGVARGRDKVSLERLAKNFKSGRDVDGMTCGGLIDTEGEELLSSTIWNGEIGALRDANPSLLADSEDAGSYLCNYVLYRALRRFPDKKVGFLHVAAFEDVDEQTQQGIVRDVIDAIES